MSNTIAYLTGKKAHPLKVKSGEIYKPAAKDVLIKNASIAFNPVDYKIQSDGFYVEEFPYVLGCDVAGTVEAVGPDVKNFKKGDRVLSFSSALMDKDSRRGAFQAYSLGVAQGTTHIPESMSFDTASTIPLGVATAVHGLFHKDFLNLSRPDGTSTEKKDVDVLVWGGASSVGQYAIQLASLAGYNVYTTASPKHHDKLIALGATKAFDYNSPSIIEDIKKISPKLSVVYDSISEGSTPQQCIDVLADGGAIAATLPYQITPPSNVQIKQVFAALLLTSSKDLGVWLFNEWLPKALKDETFVGNDVEKRPNGIHGIQAVLDEYHNKGISGAKFVINP